MPTALTPSDIATAIKTIVVAASPNAVVIPQQVLGLEDENNDADIFRAVADSNRIHAWMFWRSAAGMKRVGDVAYNLDHAARTRRFDKTWTYTFRFYYEYATGTDANSAKLAFDAEIEAVSDALAKKPKLGLTNENLKQHDDLQFAQLPIIDMGDVKVLAAFGRLDVQIYKSIAP